MTRAERIAPRVGLGIAVGLAAAAIVLPHVFGWNVHVGDVPPLLADFTPQVGPGTPFAVAIGVAALLVGPRLAGRLGWRPLLAVVFVVCAAWIIGLATVEGLAGISRVFENPSEYLRSAREVTDVGTLLRGFIARIPLTAPDHWPVHVAGDPPGALLYFVLLVRLGLGTGLASGLVSILLAAATPVAVLVCLRALGAEAAARRIAPLLALMPAAVWLGVTADAVFGAVVAWGLCCLAIAATSPGAAVRFGCAVAAGLLLGLGVFLSYGMTLMALPAIGVLLAARSWRPLPIAVGSALAVAAAFAIGGFAWWQAYPVLVQRYWAGIAPERPGLYWIWADLAVVAIAAGPVVGAGLAATVVRLRAVREPSADRPVVLLTVAVAAAVLAADLSGLSRSEVERIWLPFLPWLLVGTALLPDRWRRAGLVMGVVIGLAVEHLLHTAW